MEFESTNSGTTVRIPILKLAHENGTSVTKMSIPVTAEEKTNKKNDVKARSLLLMALPNEHQLTFTTKKTQKTLLKQQYENFSASSAESLDSIFNRLQKIVSRLAILGVVIAQEDLNSKFLSSLPPEWNTHVVVWMNKPEVETISIDDLYNNFKIVEQKVKKSVSGSSGAQNLAFMTAPSTSSTNDANTASPQVSTASPNVNTASPQVSTASFSDNVVYAFMVENPNGSNLLHQDLEKIHEDDLEAMDLKWQLSLLSMREKRYYERTGKKIFINANDIAGYDKTKVECFNCHKLGHFARECRAPRSKEGFDWSDMAEEQVQTNMDLMAFSDSEVSTNKTCSKTCLKNYKTLKKQCDDLIVNLNQTEFTVATYKRGLAIVEEQLITYRKNEVLFSEEVVVLKREVACKDYEINLLKSEFEKIIDKRKKGLGYSVVPSPHPLIYNRLKMFDMSYSGLDEFKEPEFKRYGPENKEQVSQDISSFVESLLNVDKETVFPIDKKGKPQQDDKGFVDSGCARHMTGNIDYLLDFKEFDGGYVAFGGGAYGGKITSKGTLKTDSLDFKDKAFWSMIEMLMSVDVNLCRFQVSKDITSLSSTEVYNWRLLVFGKQFLLLVYINAAKLMLMLLGSVNTVRHMLMLSVQVPAAEGDFIKKPVESDRFAEIIDFLKASSVHCALTVNPIIYTLGNNKGGTDCLPAATIFEELTHMGAKSTTWNEFSSTMASLIICLATNQKFNMSKYIFDAMVKHLDGGVKFLMYLCFLQVFINQKLGDMSHHKKIFVNPSHTKKFFANMKRVGKDFSGRITPLFDTMMVQASKEQKQKSKRKQRKEAEVAQDDTEHEESIPTPSNDPLPNGKDSMKLNDLMVLCTKLQTQVLDLEKAKDAQAKEITDLKKRV
ncbi:putative ribonuclease H-like domain-containing protein [Tanacetum coccineum]